ncbi:hypothetical protein ARMGADRAFT_1082654 [Armillaria gallica]|uniref:Uncharacterized protein n=1 Tax=Armillaria gallica TaxID=47427 RepID=A0A2H3D8D6_ARMGA|nr:hypothetical protein ARMGADRAFT_1082654 [Armillaria gallica]
MFLSFYVILTAFLLQVFGLPIRFTTGHAPPTSRVGTVVSTREPQDADCFHLFSFEPRVPSGRGQSAESFLAARTPPISFGVAGPHYVDTLPNEIFAQCATPEGLSNFANRDLHEDINGGNTTSGDVEKNNRHGSGGNSTSGSGIDPGSGNEAGSKIVNVQSNGHPGCEVLTGGNTTNGDANGGSVTATSTSSGGGDVRVGNGGKTTKGDANGGNVTVPSTSSGDGDVIVGNGGNTINGDANGGNVTAPSTSSGGGDVIVGNGGKTTNGDANGGNVNVGDAISDSATSTSAIQMASASSTSPTTDASRHRTNTPIIIGSVIGSLALAVMLGILWRRRKRRLRDKITVTSNGESLRTDFRHSDIRLPSDDVFPEPRMVPPSRSYYSRPRDGGQSLEDQILRTEAVGTTYGESPPPSYLISH